MNSPSNDRVVRKTQGNDKWFPGNRKQLEAMVTSAIEDAGKQPVTGRIVAVLSPHAGYAYSGKVAGYTFRALRDDPSGPADVVVILGFTHQQNFSGVALMDGDAISTPLGETDLDKDSASVLKESSGRIFFDHKPHLLEHSAENQVPFVQVALPKARLVIGLIGDHDSATVADLVKALQKLAAKKRIVVIASTDMLHDPDYELVGRRDAATLLLVKDMDDKSIGKEWSISEQVFCGIMPVLASIAFSRAEGCTSGTVLRYRNSGDDFPESRGTWVVGYCAAAFCVQKKK